MNNSRYQWTLYVIVAVIVSTITIQVYWNYKNYQTNKQQFINEVQTSLDNAVDKYYTNLAEESTVGFIFRDSTSDSTVTNHTIDSIFKNLSISDRGINLPDSVKVDFDIKNIQFFRGLKTDSLLDDAAKRHQNIRSLEALSYKHQDSNFVDRFQSLTSKVVISLATDSLKTKEIDSFFKIEKATKKLEFEHELHAYINLYTKDSIYDHLKKNSELLIQSKSAFLAPPYKLFVTFSNASKEILKRSLTGILISSLLILAVISCLFYLLKIIKHQKQLAEVKNDLISNITHEFKTPIATIGVALESIKDFDAINDKEKTKSYLNISNTQLGKLNLMVEKLLETATLDSEDLDLKKESINLVELIESLIKKHALSTNKSIIFNCAFDTIPANIDLFHFENAINNIIDNAIKYGGDHIEISITKNKNASYISISDNGNTLTKAYKEKIFEKFYRIPKGNTHDVKGFGIGLYYTKKIIEKHNGTITLDLENDITNFKIALPNE